MAKVYTRRSGTWEILHSWWILLTFFPMGGASFLGFLYAGFSVRKKSWTVIGFANLIVFVFLFSIASTSSGLVAVLIWIATIIYVFKIRPAYLVYLDVYKRKKEALEKIMISKLREDAERNFDRVAEREMILPGWKQKRMIGQEIVKAPRCWELLEMPLQQEVKKVIYI